MSRHEFRTLIAAAFLLVIAITTPFVSAQRGTPAPGRAQRGTMPPGAMTSGLDRVLSPSVVATWISHADSQGAPQLDVLVLWRGTPGWVTRRSGGGGSSGGSAGGRGGTRIVTSSIRFGSTVVELTFDLRTRSAVVAGHMLAMGDANVILVDNVDDPAGPAIVGTRRVDPVIPAGGGPDIILPLLRQSGELLDFLRCELRPGDPRMPEQMEFLCAQALGRCDARLANPTLQKMLEVSCRQ